MQNRRRKPSDSARGEDYEESDLHYDTSDRGMYKPTHVNINTEYELPIHTYRKLTHSKKQNYSTKMYPDIEEDLKKYNDDIETNNKGIDPLQNIKAVASTTPPATTKTKNLNRTKKKGNIIYFIKTLIGSIEFVIRILFSQFYKVFCYTGVCPYRVAGNNL